MDERAEDSAMVLGACQGEGLSKESHGKKYKIGRVAPAGFVAVDADGIADAVDADDIADAVDSVDVVDVVDVVDAVDVVDVVDAADETRQGVRRWQPPSYRIWERRYQLCSIHLVVVPNAVEGGR